MSKGFGASVLPRDFQLTPSETQDKAASTASQRCDAQLKAAQMKPWEGISRSTQPVRHCKAGTDTEVRIDNSVAPLCHQAGELLHKKDFAQCHEVLTKGMQVRGLSPSAVLSVLDLYADLVRSAQDKQITESFQIALGRLTYNDTISTDNKDGLLRRAAIEIPAANDSRQFGGTIWNAAASNRLTPVNSLAADVAGVRKPTGKLNY